LGRCPNFFLNWNFFQTKNNYFWVWPFLQSSNENLKTFRTKKSLFPYKTNTIVFPFEIYISVSVQLLVLFCRALNSIEIQPLSRTSPLLSSIQMGQSKTINYRQREKLWKTIMIIKLNKISRLKFYTKCHHSFFRDKRQRII
jgi:hypothetical protein